MPRAIERQPANLVGVTPKAVSDQLAAVDTVPRKVELAARDNVTIRGVGRMGYRDMRKIRAALQAAGRKRVYPLPARLADKNCGVRVKGEFAVASEVARG